MASGAVWFGLGILVSVLFTSVDVHVALDESWGRMMMCDEWLFENTRRITCEFTNPFNGSHLSCNLCS